MQKCWAIAVVAAIEQADRRVGRLLRAIHERERYHEEEWLIVICTDHGGRGLGHHQGHQFPEVRQVFTIDNSPRLTAARIDMPTYLVDIAPTVMQHLGLPVRDAWSWDGSAIAQRAIAAPLQDTASR